MNAQSKLQTVRILHHLSCVGGTIISRCLSAMHEVALLSEVNPLSRIHTQSDIPKFSPTDLTYLAIKGCFPQADDLSKKLFQADIKVIIEHLSGLNKQLVIREHTHSDYLGEKEPTTIGTIRNLLQQDYQLISILNIRHPVDSYLSMLIRNWVNFAPATFDEYCRRYLLFINQNGPQNIFRYEDFVRDPAAQMQAMCSALSLTYDDDFQKRMNRIEFTGGSGRSSIDTISLRERRGFDRDFAMQAARSKYFHEICSRFDYSTDLNRQP